MKIKFNTIVFLFILTASVFGKIDTLSAEVLSDSSRISVLTASPGEELYSAFGHTGIRITDFKNNFDVVFNYGTFDFEQPGFYTNFVKGKMRYMLWVDRFEDFMKEYIDDKRSISDQELNLTLADKQNIFAFLNNNALPENREYFYDFFWDNCATRPRDVFEKILGNRLQYHTNSVGFEKNKTMHDMLRHCVGNRAWVDYGFDLILGIPCEVIASPRDQTFLPEYLAKYIDCAKVDGNPFVLKKELLLQFPLPTIETGFQPIHLNLILVLLFFVVWVIERKRNKHFYLFDFFLFFVMGLVGTFFLFLWIFTSHYSVPENLNLFWLIPSHAVVAFLLLRKKKPEWLRFYFIGTSILMILLAIFWKWLPQYYNIAVMPLLFLLFFRSFLVASHLKQGQEYK
jgi:hypothetical protein